MDCGSTLCDNWLIQYSKQNQPFPRKIAVKRKFNIMAKYGSWNIWTLEEDSVDKLQPKWKEQCACESSQYDRNFFFAFL
jgi:hypothetical protein